MFGKLKNAAAAVNGAVAVYMSVKYNMSEDALSKARAKTDDIFGNNESGIISLS